MKTYEFLFSEDWGLIRQGTGPREIEWWHNGRWEDGPPSVIDAVIGGGEDQWSCGECAYPWSDAQASEYADAHGINLFEETTAVINPHKDDINSDRESEKHTSHGESSLIPLADITKVHRRRKQFHLKIGQNAYIYHNHDTDPKLEGVARLIRRINKERVDGLQCWIVDFENGKGEVQRLVDPITNQTY